MLNFEADQIARIDTYRAGGGISSRAEAIRLLVEDGLTGASLSPAVGIEVAPRRQRNVLTIPEILASCAGKDAVSAMEVMRACGVRENTRNWLLITAVMSRAGFVPVAGRYGEWKRPG